MTSYIIFAFVSGFLLATVIFWIVTRQLQKDWHAEYRRLMGGIKKAWIDIDTPNIPHPFIANDLRKLYYDEPNWPRG